MAGLLFTCCSVQGRAQEGAVAAMPQALAGAVTHDAVAAPVSLEGVLHDLFQRADIIFAGEVLSIDRDSTAVTIRWQVEDAVRGTTAGAVYALREWSGLWQETEARYTVGQRALLLLHAPSAAGFASPVGGPDGVVPLRGTLPDGVLDLRLLAQRVVATDAARLRPMQALQRAAGSFALSSTLQASAALPTGRVAARAARPLQAAPEQDAATAPDTAAQQPGTTISTPAGGAAAVPADSNSHVDGAMLLGMLHSWQRERAAAR